MKTKFTDSTRYPNGYKQAVETDIKATFRRIRAEQKAKAEQEAADSAEAEKHVVPMISPRKKAG